MRTHMPATVGLPGAALVGLSVWVSRVLRYKPVNAGYPRQLLHGADEYWNGDYPESERR